MGKPPTKISQSDERTPHVLSDDDEKALSEFCDAVPLDDISFSSWQASLKDLNLQIPLFVRPSDLLNQIKKEISFVRTIKIGNKKDKKKVVILVELLDSYRDGDEIILKDEGDVFNENKGHLIIRLKVVS